MSRLVSALAALPASLTTFACSSDPISIGTAPLDDEQLTPDEAACGNGAVSGNVTATTQDQIDALAGCEVVHGDLSISTFPGMDLRPLGALRVVDGSLVIGPSLPSSLDGSAAPIASLEGLEALEQANGISLVGVSDPDLSALASLSSLRRDPGRWPQSWPQTGYLAITNSHGLTSLAGLERLREWDSLLLEANPNLESLTGLQPPSNLGTIDISQHPRLQDVTALASARQVDQLILSGSQVENLDALELESVTSLTLRDNPVLAQIDGLRTLRLVTILRVENNDRLERMPELRLIGSIEELVVNGNARLQSIPAYDGGTLEVRQVEIIDNAALVEVDAPYGNPFARQLSISDNPSLSRLNLTSFVNVDSLSIRDNAGLAQLDIGALSTVDVLEVVGNPLLSVGGFARVRTFESNIEGNLDTPAP